MFGFGKSEPTATEKIDALLDEARAAQSEGRPLPGGMQYWPGGWEQVLEEASSPDRPEDWPKPVTHQRQP